MTGFIKLKNATRRVQELFLNGLKQRRGYDYTLNSKGIQIKGPIAKESNNLVTLLLEENYVI